MSRPATAPADGRPSGKKGKKKKKVEEEPPPPPPPPPIPVQVRSVAWKCMDFRIEVAPVVMLSDIKALIIERHAKATSKDLIRRMNFWFDDVAPDKLIETDMTPMGEIKFSRKGETGLFELFYEYQPHHDPFEGRPFAAVLNATNPQLSMPKPRPPAPPASA
mmetsp:Transcript_38542/g.106406  ORF Transcript_38542/g.106406 Transcript_38542/m.106406 type:complete len:162 (+) Transcript_38542:151-636(+)